MESAPGHIVNSCLQLENLSVSYIADNNKIYKNTNTCQLK